MKVIRESIGVWFVWVALLGQGVFAADVSVRLDREEISQDESVELKIQVQGEERPKIGEIQYQSPGLELINQYEGVQSHFTSYNGVTSRGITVSITHVLRPTRSGALKISGIRIPVDGKVATASDLVVQVIPPGARGNVGGPGAALRGGARTKDGEVFLTTEVSQETLFKGQQVIISYYLYAQVRIADQAPEKYPELSGFLKEELEMPFMQGRPVPERVTRGGRSYDRYLVAKYAAYPIQAGKLTVNGLALKYTYLPRVDQDYDDPFSIQGFFQGIAPRTASVRGKDATVEVLPLPDAGKPVTFTGGVGDFSVSAATNKDRVKLNEAITLKIKVEGRGNLAAMGEPRVNWPSGLEVYDTQGKSTVGRGGVGDKVFDVVLIPKAAGSQGIPAIEFSFFDPVQKKYYTRSTEPMTITVEPGAADAGDGQKPTPDSAAPGSAASGSAKSGGGILRKLGMFFGALAAVFLIGALVWGIRMLKRGGAEPVVPEKRVPAAKPQSHSAVWAELRAQIPGAEAPAGPAELEAAYAGLELALTLALKRVTGLDLRSSPRSEVYEKAQLPPEIVRDLQAVAEYSEALRYAARVGAVRYEDARAAWPAWRTKVCDAINSLSNRDVIG